MQANKAPLAVGAAAALLLFGAGLYWGGRVFDRAPPVASMPVDIGAKATVLPQPKPLPTFSLTDHQGKPFTRDSFEGRWTYLFFGYTHCPDVCPTTLALLDQVDKALKADPDLVQPHYAFVSVDPERDTPQHLAEYVPYFNPGFVGATGDDDQILALTRRLGIIYRRHPNEGGGYLVDHSASILLVDPSAGLRALHSAPHDAATVADDYKKIIAAYGG